MRKPALVVALGLALVGCREPDLGPLRADLETNAAAVCAPAPARPPHGKTTRATPANAELDAALGALCSEHGALAEDAYLVVREALAADRALVGHARRSQMLVRAPRAEDVLSGKVEAGAHRLPGCDPSSMQLEKKVLASAVTAFDAGRHADALARCGDVLALARDGLLTGNMTDAMIIIANLDRFGFECHKVIAGSPKELANEHLATYRALRAGFPSALRDTATRDHAEMAVFHLGRLRDRAKPLPCSRAQLLASTNDGEELTRRDRIALVEAWNESRSEDPAAGIERYENGYRDALERLDKVLAR